MKIVERAVRDRHKKKKGSGVVSTYQTIMYKVGCRDCDETTKFESESQNEFETWLLLMSWVELPDGKWICPKCSPENA